MFTDYIERLDLLVSILYYKLYFSSLHFAWKTKLSDKY